MNARTRTMRAETGLRWAAIALGASLPISVALDNLLFVAILVCWLGAADYRRRLLAAWRDPVVRTTLALLALLLVGCAYGPGNAQDSAHFLRKYSNLLLIPLLLSSLWTPRHKDYALAGFAAAMALTLLLSYAFWWHLIPLERLENRQADNPVVFKLHITHGIFMAYAAYLAAVEALRRPQLHLRLLLGAGALLAAFNVLFMVQGRTGYLVLGALAAWFFFVCFRWRGLALAGLAGLVLLAAAWMLHLPLVDRLALMLAEYQQWRPGGGGDTSIGIRLDYYRSSLAIIAGHPFFGVGTGGFMTAYAAVTAGSGLPVSNNPHNQYLLVTAQFGLLGLLLLLALFISVWRSARRLPQTSRLAAQGLVITLVLGCLLNSLLIDHSEGMFFAWLVGVLLAPTAAPSVTANDAAR